MKLYVVQQGDTMEGIAAKHGMTIQEFQHMNDQLNEESLVPGLKVKVSTGSRQVKIAAPNARSEQAQSSPAAPEQAQTQTNAVPHAAQTAPASGNASGTSNNPAEYGTIFYPTPPASSPSAGQPNSYTYGPGYALPPHATPYPSAASVPGYPGFSPSVPNAAGQGGVGPNYYPVAGATTPPNVQPAAGTYNAPGFNQGMGGAAGPNGGSAINPYFTAGSVSGYPTTQQGTWNVSAASANSGSSVAPAAAGSAGNAAISAYHPTAAPSTSQKQQPNSQAAAGYPGIGKQLPGDPALNAAAQPVLPAGSANSGKSMYGGQQVGNGTAAKGGGTVGGYPYPYMPKPAKPCGCGGSKQQPLPYSPFGMQQPIHYYAGNQPPVEMQFSELPHASAQLYQTNKKDNDSAEK